MNKSYMLSNLKEAQEQLAETIQNLEQDPDYEYGSYLVEMMHLYHHINTAWNARDESTEATNECSEQDFYRWRAMPSSEELMLEQS